MARDYTDTEIRNLIDADAAILDNFALGLSVEQVAQRMGISRTRVYQRYNRVLTRIRHLTKLPFDTVIDIIRPRGKNQPPAPNVGLYSADASTLERALGLLHWESARREVVEAQIECCTEDPFYDVRAWLRAHSSAEKLEGEYSLAIHLLAWRLFVRGRNLWVGSISDLSVEVGLKDALAKRRDAITRAVLEPAKKDLEIFGDFQVAWAFRLVRGAYEIALEFTPCEVAAEQMALGVED